MKRFDADQPGYGLARLAASGGDMNAHLMLAHASDALFEPASAVGPSSPTDKCAPDASTATLYRHGGKRALETLLIVLGLPFFAPVIALCALALWIEGGNPFYRQDRLGQNGKRFSILKLRTMVRDADAVLESYLLSDPAMRREWDEKQKLIHDPRVTRVGKLLRASSIDELPQLWNVLTGEMSLIGPRPMMPDQLEMYGDMTHYDALRPGITGLWQVSARNESRFSFRNEVDATYDASLSLAGDVAIIFRTVGVMLRRTGC
jgi:lipopolysaccharide/colanic/teichoic acid biosynthesis glycosyltransferase